jgi:hypothetical protein
VLRLVEMIEPITDGVDASSRKQRSCDRCRLLPVLHQKFSDQRARFSVVASVLRAREIQTIELKAVEEVIGNRSEHLNRVESILRQQIFRAVMDQSGRLAFSGETLTRRVSQAVVHQRGSLPTLD